MTHRHLDFPRDLPVERWPRAALVDVLERGDLEAWRPLAEAVARDPHGPFADTLLRLLDAYPSYGTAPLWRAWIDRARARTEGPLRAERPLGLPALRRRLGLTQERLAARIGMTQSDLSKLERRDDVRVSTLRAFARGLGGRLSLVFRRGARSVELRIPVRAAKKPPGREVAG